MAHTRTFSYLPRADEAWLFNSRNPHLVSPPAANAGDRLAVMWVELREVAWLMSIVGSLSIVSIGVAVGVAMLASG